MSSIVAARLALVFAALGFLMPWLQVLGGFVQLSGLSLATGVFQGGGGRPYLPVSGVGVAVLIALLLSIGGNKRAAGGSAGAAAVVGIVLMLLGAWLLRSEAARNGAAGLGSEGMGFWLTLVCLVGAAAAGFMTKDETASPAVAASQIQPAPLEDDVAAWDVIKNKDHADSLQDYLLRHPQGRFAEFARMKLERMGMRPLEPANAQRVEVAAAPVSAPASPLVAAKPVVQDVAKGGPAPITIVIGRSNECDIKLTDSSASRRHATLFVRGDQDIELVDNKSSNGTFLQDGASWKRITASQVKPTDFARFGSQQMTIASILTAVAGGGGAKAGPSGAVVARPGGVAAAGEAAPKFKNPRRNPLTGKLEGD